MGYERRYFRANPKGVPSVSGSTSLGAAPVKLETLAATGNRALRRFAKAQLRQIASRRRKD